MTQIVQKALELLRPHRSNRLYPLCFVSESTRTTAKRIFELLSGENGEKGELTTAELEEIKRLIEESSTTDARSIFNVVNWDGFTILQRCVINDHVAVVKMLLKKGIDVNAGICSLPLHLACRLGHVHVAQLLLTYGARVELESNVCYQEEHKLKTYPDQIVCLAYQPVSTPVLHAISGDHEQMLQLLLHHENSRQLVKTDFLLHEACKMGAPECSRYLLQRYSEQMSMENNDGKTPLQISLIMDTDNAIFLMHNGVELKETVFLTEDGSTLHEMYRSKVTLGLAKSTRFALEHGFKAHVNKKDSEGNTALNVLLRHVGRTVRTNIQSDFDNEVVDCVHALLEHGANPNIANRVGESALHAVLSDHATRPLYVNRHGQVRRLKPVLQEIIRMVEVLLKHGANPAQRSSPVFISPLYYAIRIFQSLQLHMFVIVKTALRQLILLLCQENVDVNKVDSYQLTPFLHITNTALKWVNAQRTNAAFCLSLLPFVGDLLQHFLKCGLNANAQLNYWTRRMDVAIESTYFREVALFLNVSVEDPRYYEQVKLLMLKLIQRGGDPNLLDFTPLYGTPYQLLDEIPKDRPLSLLLARSLYLKSSTTLPAVLDALSLFHKSLVQEKHTEFIEGVAHFIHADLKNTPLDPCAMKAIHQCRHQPRHLKELCRIQVAIAMGWRLSKRCSKLPLPRFLVQYILNLE